MARPSMHVFVCTQQRPAGHPRGSCAEKGCADVYNAFASALVKHNLFSRIALTQTGCLGPCQTGANVLIYPDAVLYIQMTANDVEQVIEKHLLRGEVLLEKIAPPELW